jgi:hypothetical protein
MCATRRVVVFPTQLGGRPPMPQDDGVPTAGHVPPAAACRFSATSPAPWHCNPSPRLTLTRRHQGFAGVHPSGLPLTCDHRMERRPLGLNSELRTPPSPVAHVRAGTGIEHSPGATSSLPPILQTTSPLATCDLVSHHLKSAFRSRRGLDVAIQTLPGQRHFSHVNDQTGPTPRESARLGRGEQGQ